MTPVELRLSNFLSYGESAPPLDFEAFQTACISGGNGQGKSSLLDALTWALWGQARKGTANNKPDADLLRKGAQRMVVDLTFDHDGQRYRVRRAYGVSKSGKTPRPELDVFAADGADWQALTSTSVSETQRVLDRILRIDYDTFVNASMLLQGRADEFTRKRPTERKEVLARILGLDRYERLEARASERLSRARSVRDAAERERDRLGAIADTAADADAVLDGARAAEAAARATRDAARADLDAARQRLAAAAGDARQLDDLRARDTRLASELADLDRQRAALGPRLDAAERLIADADGIEAAFVRYEAVDAEARRLADLAARHRDAERAVTVLDVELREARHAAERRLDAAAAEVSTLDARHRAATDAAAQRSAVESALEQARRAAREAEALNAARADARRLDDVVRDLDADLVAARRDLEREIGALETRRADLRRAAEHVAETQRRADALATASDDRAAAEKTLEQLVEAGQDARARAEAATAESDRLVRDRDDALDLAARLADGDETGECPACGGRLTPERRAALVRDKRRLAADLDLRIDEAKAGAENAHADRAALLERHRATTAVLKDARQREDVYLRLHIELREMKGVASDLRAVEADLVERVRRLDGDAFAPEVRERRARAVADRAAVAYDPAMHERLQATAARVPDLVQRLRDIDAAESTAATLATERAARQADLDRLRRDVASGSVYGDLPVRVEAARAALTAVGYDADADRRVRADREALRDAPMQRERLRAAREARADLATDAARLAERHADLAGERASLATRLHDLAALDQTRDAARQAEASAAEALQHAEAALDEARTACTRAEVDRERVAAAIERLAEASKAVAEAQAEEDLHRHLRAAFSRSGIPSLIIEDALPEVESRANDLLDRLSDGRMRLAFQTQRDRKSDGGTIETLDLQVADETGQMRSYETFSGGEAFRVNFALRVALSQMLAARSGVTVRTLIIDEGFGTQDETGVRLLIEAINSVRDDFEKILVITHLDEMKEAFPVRIEVRKDPVTGSTFELLGV